MGGSSLFMNISLIANATCFPLLYKYSGTMVGPGATSVQVCERLGALVVEWEPKHFLELQHLPIWVVAVFGVIEARGGHPGCNSR
jgi:hypothetical protein